MQLLLLVVGILGFLNF